MDPKDQIPVTEETIEELDMDSTSSVDDFIKELEAKEKDLHITSDLTIEISDSEFDPRNIPDDFSLEPMVTQRPSLGDVKPAAVAAVPGSKTRIYELEQEIERLNKRIAQLRDERNEVQEKSDRRLKDFENYKYRMDRERRGAFIDQITNLAKQMLPVLDNLDRAVEALERSKAEQSSEFQPFYDGIALVHQQVNEVFSEMGVQPIATVGERFDPNFHEAVATEQREDMPGNTVSEEMLRGYRIGNRVIRHSMVRVSVGRPPVRPEPMNNSAGSTGDELPDLDPPDQNTDDAELPDLDPPDDGESETLPAE